MASISSVSATTGNTNTVSIFNSRIKGNHTLFFHFCGFSTTHIPPHYSCSSLKRTQELAIMFNNDISRKDHADTVVQIDTEPELDEKSGSNAGQPRMRLLNNLNPAKAVIGGITQSTSAVIGGISQSTNAVKGGLSHSRWISTVYALSFSQSLPPHSLNLASCSLMTKIIQWRTV